ncbi:LacI family DNA-binding transcriptional regulator [Pseudomonas fluorescens]|uniref:LacI family transcriptional regulator n=1 Tax=Pseudomonas fluorescens TaxID=294 RepID=A0A0F4VDN3_PSEFL|nr:LacI family DNA-binding transcriptional regulator [Pseudomonas fluorescens]KJZ66839.1 LacI family transcriptional regulator [Pseudomonas fluorescens]
MASVSMKDVALAAGVSQPAVSYAYNRPSKLSQAQREHILEVAASLGYPGPNVLGRSLRSGKIGAIGLMMMDKLSLAFADPCTIALLRGISEVGELENVALTLFPLNNNRLVGRAQAANHGSLALRGLVDGLIISTLPDDHPAVLAVVKQNIPFVVIDSPLVEDSFFVGIDDRGAARTQMQHLLDLGHRKIGIIIDRLNPDGYRGPIDQQRFKSASERIVRERLTGYVEAASVAGLAFEDLSIIEAGGLDSTAGQAAAFTLLTSNDVTAVVACSDVMAIACMKTAHALNRNVPQTLSVIGFDDIPEAVQLGLTTIGQPMVEKGVYAARMLTEQLNAPAGTRLEPEQKIFATKLIVRTSTLNVQAADA